MSTLTPVAPRERVATLDVLRGFALLGVLIGNSYALYSLRMLERPKAAGVLDIAARWFVALFVQSKAQTLLTFLFGFGFAVQLLRAEQRGEPVMGLYLRRLFVLLLIGILHVMLWWGDVTWTYAIAGFGLLLFQRASNRTRIAWAFALIFIPTTITSLPAVRNLLVGLVATEQTIMAAMKSLAAAAHGKRFWPVVPAHVRFALVWQVPIYASYYWWLLGRFLLGYVAGKQRWFDDDGAHRLPLFRKLVLYGLIADLPAAIMTVAMLLRPPSGAAPGVAWSLAFSIGDEVGLLGLTAAYIGMVVLLMQRARMRRLLMLVAPAGRMPLTTYISQSVISTFLYYGWGLGLAGKLRSATVVALSFAIFALQVVACQLWLRRFRFGPLEWVWRTLVYLRPPPMRIASTTEGRLE